MVGSDTIVALSTGSLPSGVAIVRISGPAASSLLQAVAGPLPSPRHLRLAALFAGSELIDHGLIAWFPSPQSFTGEDCAELQVHGSPAVVRGLLRHLTGFAAVRLAEPGEFTRRAFENGRLDLTAVEGLGDLLSAETDAQRRHALARADGMLARQVGNWREVLLDCRAEIEARLDFADEGDVDQHLPQTTYDAIRGLRHELTTALGELERGRIIRDGFRVALAGPPNAGKSSLLNALAKSDLAIVSDEPGTTRDVREVELNLAGQLVVLVDMAGLRDADSRAEAEGVRRARLELTRADLILWLAAPDVDAEPDIGVTAPVWQIATKVDLGGVRPAARHRLSAVTGAGVQELLDDLSAMAAASTAGEPPLLDRERDRVAVNSALSALASIDQHWAELELAAEDLRVAAQALARLTGQMDAEAVLDRLFLSFCIGK